MNYTKAKIFNMALKNLGVSVGVQSVEQTDRNTNVLNEFYDLAKEKTLSDYDWGFASAYRTLTLTIETSPNPKFTLQYDYPNNCVKIREIVAMPEEEQIEFEIATNENSQRVVLTNKESASVRYTKLISDETYYTPEFAMALSWYLSFLSAKSITGARVNTNDCLQVYKQMIAEGKLSDANEGYIKPDDSCEWLEV